MVLSSSSRRLCRSYARQQRYTLYAKTKQRTPEAHALFGCVCVCCIPLDSATAAAAASSQHNPLIYGHAHTNANTHTTCVCVCSGIIIIHTNMAAHERYKCVCVLCGVWMCLSFRHTPAQPRKRERTNTDGIHTNSRKQRQRTTARVCVRVQRFERFHCVLLGAMSFVGWTFAETLLANVSNVMGCRECVIVLPN